MCKKLLLLMLWTSQCHAEYRHAKSIDLKVLACIYNLVLKDLDMSPPQINSYKLYQNYMWHIPAWPYVDAQPNGESGFERVNQPINFSTYEEIWRLMKSSIDTSKVDAAKCTGPATIKVKITVKSQLLTRSRHSSRSQ